MMRMRALGVLALACSSGVAWTPAAAQYVPRAELVAAAQAASLHVKSLSDEVQLTAVLRQAPVQLAGSPLQAEAAMHATLMRLRETLRPLPATRKAVAQLMNYSSQIRTDAPDPDHGRGQTAIAFAIAASARGTLRHWDLKAAEAQIAQHLRTGSALNLSAPIDDRAWARYIDAATPAELDAVQARGLPDSSAALAAWWQRRPDADTAARLLSLPVDTNSYAVLETLPAWLPADAARNLLIATERQPALRSAARLALGQLAADDALARQHLLSTLGDAEGASSAQALSAAGDASLDALREILSIAPEGPRLQHALLALRAMPHGEAHALLRGFTDDAVRPPALRAEVQSWLR